MFGRGELERSCMVDILLGVSRSISSRVGPGPGAVDFFGRCNDGEDPGLAYGDLGESDPRSKASGTEERRPRIGPCALASGTATGAGRLNELESEENDIGWQVGDTQR